MQKIQDAVISQGDRVLVRCDLDVPVQNGKILEKYRLESALETLRYLITKGAVPVIAGHIGKPNGKTVPSLSTEQLLPFFTENLPGGNFELMENLRFYSGEEENSEAFCKTLAAKAKLYVNESFATCHRNHASITGVTKLMPHYAGFRLQREVETLSKVITNPARPLMTVIGGAKIESKMPVISKFLPIADKVILGGKLGDLWQDTVPANLILPVDNVDGKDIGPQTIEKYIQVLSQAKTILWAGPLGMYQDEKYMTGTRKIAEAVAKLTKGQNITSVIGGGDTIAAIEKAGFLNQLTFVSTGGSSMLQYLADETLPGLEALN